MANRDAKLIERTLKDFSLGAMSGGSGGSVIVDALPAEGVEGTTYLLRKTIPALEFKLVTAIRPNYYFGNRIIVSNDISISEKLEQVIEQKVGKLDEESIHKEFDFYNYQIVSVEEYQELVSREGVAIIHSEEDLASLEPSITNIMYEQDIKVEDLSLIEDYNDFSSGQYHLRLSDYIDDIVSKFYVEESDREFTIGRRKIVLNEFNKYVFTEWESTSPEIIQIIETITDMVEPLDYFDDKEYGEGVKITLTPEVESYTYTQYVFDKGVYTEVSSKSDGSSEEYVIINTEVSGTEGELTSADLAKLNNGAKIKLTISAFYVTSGLVISSGQHEEDYEFVCSLARKSESWLFFISADHSYVVTVDAIGGFYSVAYGDLEHYITVLVMDEGSTTPRFQFTCRCDDRQVYSKEDLARYLHEKGFIYRKEVSEDEFRAFSENYLPIVSNSIDTDNNCRWYGIAVDGSDLILMGDSYYISSEYLHKETIISSNSIESAIIVHLMDVGYKL